MGSDKSRFVELENKSTRVAGAFLLIKYRHIVLRVQPVEEIIRVIDVVAGHIDKALAREYLRLQMCDIGDRQALFFKREHRLFKQTLVAVETCLVA